MSANDRQVASRQRISMQTTADKKQHLTTATARIRRSCSACTPVEGDLLGLDLPVLHIHLVPAQDNGDILTHPAQHARTQGGPSPAYILAHPSHHSIDPALHFLSSHGLCSTSLLAVPDRLPRRAAISPARELQGRGDSVTCTGLDATWGRFCR